jgi:hypothetical protein
MIPEDFSRVEAISRISYHSEPLDFLRSDVAGMDYSRFEPEIL